MFFLASKTLGLIFEPVTFLILVGLCGLLLGFTRFARLGWIAMAVVIGAFAILCFSPVSALIMRPLEDRFSQPSASMQIPAGIIVLGGALDEDITESRGQVTLTDAAARLTSGAALARRYPTARLVFTGGSANVDKKGLDEARGVHDLWTSLGVPESQMSFEDQSRNTFENATMTRALVHPKSGDTWILLTSAVHMPRSIGIFRRIGWPLVAYPVDYRTFGDARDYRLNANGVEALKRLQAGLHEWVGLIAYRVTGKTDTLFPAP